jgi:NADH dehydrogenase
MSNGLPKVVIVGGGFGGIETAKELRHASVEVTVVDRQNHHCFQPLLYQVATAALSPADIAWPIRHILRKQKNATVLMEEVRAIDTTKRRVETHSVSMPYDYLVLATGAAHSYFGHDEWPKLLLASNALKTLPGYDGASSSPSSARSFPWTKPSVSASSHS